MVEVYVCLCDDTSFTIPDTNVPIGCAVRTVKSKGLATPQQEQPLSFTPWTDDQYCAYI